MAPGRCNVYRLSPIAYRLWRVEHVEPQPIICQFYTGRQARIGRGMRQIVTDVCEVRACRGEPLDNGERFGDGEMGRMRSIAQGVEHEEIDAVEERP